MYSHQSSVLLCNLHILKVNVGTMELYQKYRFEKPLNTYSKSANEERIEAAYQAAVEQVVAYLVSLILSYFFSWKV